MNVPKLRFPGFAGKWEEKPLGDIASFSKGKGISKADISPSGETPCIRYGELYTHYGTRIDEVLSATDVPVSELKLSQGGEVIVPASGEDAKDIATAAVVLRRGVALGGDLNIIRSASDGFFLASYIAGKKRLALAAMAQGNSVVHLYPAQLGSLALSFPSLPEQQKIAAFLRAVDAKLAALAARQTALGRFKAGLMQKLFSQQLRFIREDGGAFPDWQEKRLGELLVVTMGQSPDSGAYNNEGRGLPLIQGNADISNRTSAPRRFTSEVTKVCEIGDILISVRAPIGEISLSAHRACLGRGIASLKAREHQYQRFWLQFLLYYEPKWQRVGQGSTFSAISGPDIRGIKVLTPHPDEQAKIANALLAMDTKIQAVADQVTKLKTFKKGLLQQMFV